MNYDLYLVTGATGNLGSVIIDQLTEAGRKVRALVLPDDPMSKKLPADVELCFGSVADAHSLASFFEGDLTNACLIHCAGIISIATTPSASLKKVNIQGTNNILELCKEKNIGRMIYVSSVHAIPERPNKEMMDETDFFGVQRLKGSYAKSKSTATKSVLDAAKNGLNVCVVFPSGILSPFDPGRGNIASVIFSYRKNTLPAAIKGGYDFVDVRDVAQGIISCSENGRTGECYILSGHYASIKDILEYIRSTSGGKRMYYMERWFVMALSPFFEFSSMIRRKPLYLTPYSVYVLGSNANFSRKKAEQELGYRPRALASTLQDILKLIPHGNKEHL